MQTLNIRFRALNIQADRHGNVHTHDANCSASTTIGHIAKLPNAWALQLKHAPGWWPDRFQTKRAAVEKLVDLHLISADA